MANRVSTPSASIYSTSPHVITDEERLCIKAHETKAHELAGTILSNLSALDISRKALKKHSSFTQTVAQWHCKGSGALYQLSRFLSVFLKKRDLQSCEKLVRESHVHKQKLSEADATMLRETHQFLQDWFEKHLGESRGYFKEPQASSLYLLQQLCGGADIWEELPVIELSTLNKRLLTKFDMSAPLMKGKDHDDREFLAIRDPNNPWDEATIIYTRNPQDDGHQGMYKGSWLLITERELLLDSSDVLGVSTQRTTRGLATMDQLESLATLINSARES